MANESDLLEQLKYHISNVQQDPTIPLDEKLFEASNTFLAPNVTPDVSTHLVQVLAGLISTLQQDPSPVTHLLLRLLAPFSFSDILSFDFPVDLVAGLNSTAPPFNLLTLSILGKATASSNDAAVLATKPAVVLALVQLWLSTPDTAIADKAGQAIFGLLKADGQTPDHVGGITINQAGSNQGLVWRRIFGDRDVYSLFYACCSLETSHPDIQLSKRQKSLAQARLLQWLPRIASLDWDMVTRNHHPDVEELYGLKSTDRGLLQFAACSMVDHRGDVLMHMSLINFYGDLLEQVRMSGTQVHEVSLIHDLSASGAVIGNVRINLAFDSEYTHSGYSQQRWDIMTSKSISLSGTVCLQWLEVVSEISRGNSVALDFLIATGLHARSLSFYLQPENPSHDPVDVSFLYGVSAQYCSTYSSSLPDHFLRSSTLSATLLRLSKALDLTPSKWAHGDSPKHDLHVLTSIPRIALLPQAITSSTWSSSPLRLIPSNQTNADALSTLATVFHGPVERKVVKFPSDSLLSDDVNPFRDNEAAAARALFYLYLSHHPRLFADAASHAETIALKEKALAAINLITAVIMAEWAPLPLDDPSLPTESILNALMPQPALATSNTGVLAILSPPSLEHVLPYLLRPAQSFTNLVGGHGDAESTAYTVALAKYDALKALQRRLVALAQNERLPEYEEMLGVIDKRVKEGPWSQQGEVGGRVGTLEL